MPVPAALSARLAAVVDALPVRPDSRVLEIGCGPGAAARAVADRLDTGHILAIDRSARAIALAAAAGKQQITAGRMRVRQVAAEDFVLLDGDEPFDLVFAVRVGALDGRHPAARHHVMRRIAAATNPDAAVRRRRDALAGATDPEAAFLTWAAGKLPHPRSKRR